MLKTTYGLWSNASCVPVPAEPWAEAFWKILIGFCLIDFHLVCELMHVIIQAMTTSSVLLEVIRQSIFRVTFGLACQKYDYLYDIIENLTSWPWYSSFTYQRWHSQRQNDGQRSVKDLFTITHGTWDNLWEQWSRKTVGDMEGTGGETAGRCLDKWGLWSTKTLFHGREWWRWFPIQHQLHEFVPEKTGASITRLLSSKLDPLMSAANRGAVERNSAIRWICSPLILLLWLSFHRNELNFSSPFYATIWRNVG